MNRLSLKILFLFLITFFSIQSSYSEILHDEFIENYLSDKDITPITTNLDYDYTEFDRIPIKLQTLEKISLKNKNLYENKKLELRVKQNVKYNNKIILKQGTIATAEIQTYMTRGMNGVPGAIILDNFEIPGLDKSKLKSTYIKKGLSLTIFVLPLKWALTPIPGVGSLTNFIIGGNANINDKDTIIVYYYPNWGKK